MVKNRQYLLFCIYRPVHADWFKCPILYSKIIFRLIKAWNNEWPIIWASIYFKSFKYPYNKIKIWLNITLNTLHRREPHLEVWSTSHFLPQCGLEVRVAGGVPRRTRIFGILARNLPRRANKLWHLSYALTYILNLNLKEIIIIIILPICVFFYCI